MIAGRVISLRVGRPIDLDWRGRFVRTAIVKHERHDAVWLGPAGLDGDEQADLRLHGGVDKAVCAYPIEHLPGLLEDELCIGDRFGVGDDAVVQLGQPRGPCFKLAARWRIKELPDLTSRAGMWDEVVLSDRVSSTTVAETMRVTYRDRHDVAALENVAAVPALAEHWRAGLQKLLGRIVA